MPPPHTQPLNSNPKCSGEAGPQGAGLGTSLVLGFSEAVLKNMSTSDWRGMALRMVFFVTSSITTSDIDSPAIIIAAMSWLLLLKSIDSLWMMKKDHETSSIMTSSERDGAFSVI